MTEWSTLQPPYKVELNNPKKTVLVEVMKATAALSVVEDYKMLGKLNLRQLSMIGDDDVDNKATTSKPVSKQPNAGAAPDATKSSLTEADAAAKINEIPEFVPHDAPIASHQTDSAELSISDRQHTHYV